MRFWQSRDFRKLTPRHHQAWCPIAKTVVRNEIYASGKKLRRFYRAMVEKAPEIGGLLVLQSFRAKFWFPAAHRLSNGSLGSQKTFLFQWKARVASGGSTGSINLSFWKFQKSAFSRLLTLFYPPKPFPPIRIGFPGEPGRSPSLPFKSRVEIGWQI